MERDYWLGRKRASFMLAGKATSAEARLIHYQLAGLYSVKAASSARKASVISEMAATATVADVAPPRLGGPAKADELYYRELVVGAEYLASTATDPGEMAEHNRMAAIYLCRARHAAEKDRLTS